MSYKPQNWNSVRTSTENAMTLACEISGRVTENENGEITYITNADAVQIGMQIWDEKIAS